MKTKYFSMVLAALAMTSCSQNEITEMSPDANPAVGFGVYTGVQTKGTVMNENAIQTSSFGVLAYYTKTDDFGTNTSNHTPNFMWNQKIEWKSAHWKYTPLKYWPNTAEEKISFFAYAPYEASPSDGTNQNIIPSAKDAAGYPTLKFSVKMSSPKDMVDLVATNATQDNSGAEKTINLTKRTTAVPFKFLHTLSRANFFAKLDVGTITNSETKVFITGIKLRGVTNNSNSNLWATAIYKFEDGKWDYTVSSQDKAIKQTDDVDLATTDFWTGTAQTFGTDKFTTASVALDNSTTQVSLFKSNQYLFLIPPTNDGITADNDVQVQLEYSVVTLDANLTGGMSEIKTTAIASLPKTTLKAGSAYKYVFTIGLEGVTVSATVADWDNNDESTVNDAPSFTATSFDASGIAGAIGSLNTIKSTNANCNYFVITIPAVTVNSATTIDLSSADVTVTDTNFKVGDRIAIDLSKISGMSTTNTITVTPPSNWSVSPSNAVSSNTNPIILTKTAAN